MTRDAPLVSVITPAYNAVRFLEPTILSVRAQTFADWEMIVVDDGSTDGTREVVRRWSERDPRLRLLETAGRRGPAGARNAGMRAARGRYLAFLDSDDLWLPEKLETQLAFMREHGSAFSCTGYSLIDEAGRPVGRPVQVPRRIDYRTLLRSTIIGCLTVMLDREQVGEPEMPPLPQHEDLVLWFRLLGRGFVADGLQRDLARYRLVRGSASRNKVRSALHMWKVYRTQLGLGVLELVRCYPQYAWRAYWKNRR